MKSAIALAALAFGAAGATSASGSIEVAVGPSSSFKEIGTIDPAVFQSPSILRDPLPIAELSEADSNQLYQSPYSPVRVRLTGGDGDSFISSVPACSLIDASLTTDLAVVHGTEGFRSLQVRPALSPAYSGCKEATYYTSIPAAKRLRKLTVFASSVKPGAAQGLPAKVSAKGASFPGQQEVTEQEAVLHSGGLDPAQKAALEAELKAEQQRKAEAEKGFLQKYWHLLLPVVIIFAMQGLGGGGSGAAQEGEAGAAGQQRSGGGASGSSPSAGGQRGR